MSLEQKINYQLNKYPAIKKVIKRTYQTGMYAISKKIKSEGNIIRISPDDKEHEYFFGYYDKSPWDITDRYMLCMKANNTWSDVSPREKADILLIDTFKNENNRDRVKKIAETNAWNVQQSCMLQWFGPDFSSRVLYNDYRDGKYVSVILTLATMEERVIPSAVYSVSADGKFALTLDFSRLYELRPGYGYYNVDEVTKDVALPDTTAIWKVDLETGEVTHVLKYTDFANFQPRPEMKEEGSVHKVNHIMLSPNGKRFMVLYRWFCGQRKYTRLITCNVDGTDMYVLSDDDMVSHCFWKNNVAILAFENKKKGGPGYYLMRDKTQKYHHCWPQFSNDGHPSYSPDGSLVITDSYPDRARMASINLMDGDERKKENTTIARVFAPFKYDNDTRCDLHPRWNHAGNKICFDSVFEGHRGLYVVDVNKEKTMGNGKRIKVAYIFTACKQSGPIQQMNNLIRCMDRNLFEPILITLYDEPTDGSSQLSKYLDLGVKHYKCPLGKLDMILGKTKALEELLEKLNVDVIHSLGVFPDYSIARMKTGKQIITLRNYVWEDYPAKFGKAQGTVLAKLHLYAMKHTEITVACSKSLSEIYKHNLNLNYGYVCNGVNVSRYIKPTIEEKSDARKTLKLPETGKILVYSGQVIERKNQRFLLDAFVKDYKDRKDVYLLILGDGTDFAELNRKYGVENNIDFRGNVPNVEEYLKASDMYVSTSKSEGMPNGVLEAMAAGLPVVLSDIPQHLEVLDANCEAGLSYKQGNDSDLRNKMKQLMESDLQKASDAAYDVAHNVFSDSIMSGNYQELYRKIVNK